MTKPETVAQLKADVIAWLEKHEIGSDVHFHNPQEWADRGEDYCRSADLVMTFEGPLYPILNYCEIPALVDEFFELCNGHNYYYEQGTSWYLGFYPL